MHLPLMAMIPDRPVMFAASIKLGKKSGKALHPALLDAKGQRVREKAFKKLRGFFRGIAEIHLFALGHVEKLPKPFQLIEQQSPGPGRCLDQVVKEKIDGNGTEQSDRDRRRHLGPQHAGDKDLRGKKRRCKQGDEDCAEQIAGRINGPPAMPDLPAEGKDSQGPESQPDGKEEPRHLEFHVRQPVDYTGEDERRDEQARDQPAPVAQEIDLFTVVPQGGLVRLERLANRLVPAPLQGNRRPLQVAETGA